MGTYHIYDVTEATIKSWISRYGEIPDCRLCDKEIKEGDRVRASKRKVEPRGIWHMTCYDEGSVPRIKH